MALSQSQNMKFQTEIFVFFFFFFNNDWQSKANLGSIIQE